MFRLSNGKKGSDGYAMKIEVTEADIKKATLRSKKSNNWVYKHMNDFNSYQPENIRYIATRHCPIANAINRQVKLKNNVQVNVSGSSIQIDGLGTNDYYKECGLPFPAMEFIRSFDDGQKVQPIEFEVDCDLKDAIQ